MSAQVMRLIKPMQDDRRNDPEYATQKIIWYTMKCQAAYVNLWLSYIKTWLPN